MGEPIFRALVTEAHQSLNAARHQRQRATSHFHHEGHSITEEHMQPATSQEHAMALADTSAGLKDTAAQLRTSLETGASALRDALDNHTARLDGLAGDVEAVAQIADHPAMQAMEQALPVVPAAVLEGITAMLNAVDAEHAQRAEPVAA